MKRAAELGLVEAQHNLGVMYLSKAESLKDAGTKPGEEVKALSW